jgi:hypothetical protein
LEQRPYSDFSITLRGGERRLRLARIGTAARAALDQPHELTADRITQINSKSAREELQAHRH